MGLSSLLPPPPLSSVYSAPLPHSPPPCRPAGPNPGGWREEAGERAGGRASGRGLTCCYVMQEAEDSLEDWAQSLTELATMKTDLSQYIIADDVVLLQEQVEHLRCQWEELCLKVGTPGPDRGLRVYTGRQSLGGCRLLSVCVWERESVCSCCMEQPTAQLKGRRESLILLKERVKSR